MFEAGKTITEGNWILLVHMSVSPSPRKDNSLIFDYVLEKNVKQILLQCSVQECSKEHMYVSCLKNPT